VIRRLLALLLLGWALGLVWFATFLPQPLEGVKTDSVIIPTGGSGRIERGLEILRGGLARRMLVTGVDRDVKPGEFAAEYKVDAARMKCCITLDFTALDTRGNARAAAEWVAENRFRSVRLVTSDWHMRRTASEFAAVLPSKIVVVEDAVATRPSMRILVLEYHKYLAGLVTRLKP